jgi:hypothetical protein
MPAPPRQPGGEIGKDVGPSHEVFCSGLRRPLLPYGGVILILNFPQTNWEQKFSFFWLSLSYTTSCHGFETTCRRLLV